MIATEKSITVYAESTPNPVAMKFVANIMLVENEAVLHYANQQAAIGQSPLAEMLFNFPFINDVFISGNFITLTKNNLAHWEDVMLEIREFLKDYLVTQKPILSTTLAATTHATDIDATIASQHASPTTDVEKKIIAVLEEYIRPAVEQDGGLITFKSFKNGVVALELQGSCKGCPSASLTLKAGIEGLLKRMIPEVQEVVSEAMQ